MSKHHAALMYYDKGYKLYGNLKEDKIKATLLLNIGTVHHALDDIETASKYYQEAIGVNTKVDDEIS